MNILEFQDDVDPSRRWPGAVDALLRIDYLYGPPEMSQLRLLPCHSRGGVRVEERALNSKLRPPETIAWSDLPGSTLIQRCLRVIAVHYFGSVDLPARVKGQPGWSTVGASLLIEEADAARDIHFEICNENGSAVSSRWRFGRGDWRDHQAVAMHRFDADPLRALLRMAVHALPAREAQRRSIEMPSRRAARADAGHGVVPITARIGAGKPRSPVRRVAASRPVDAIV